MREKTRHQSTAFMSHNGRVVIIIRGDEGWKKSKHSTCGNQHTKINMLSFLLGESEPWLLASAAGLLGFLIVVHLIMNIGGQRKHSKTEEEKISTPAQVDPKIEVVMVGEQNTTKYVQLSKNINGTALYIR